MEEHDHPPHPAGDPKALPTPHRPPSPLRIIGLWAWFPGSLTLLFTISSALIALLNDQYSFVLSALAAGLLADLLVWWLKPAKTRPAAFRMFALVVPIVYYSLYFLVLFLTKGIGWSIHLWMGSIVLAGITGLLLSYLLVPPLAHLKETTDN